MGGRVGKMAVKVQKWVCFRRFSWSSIIIVRKLGSTGMKSVKMAISFLMISLFWGFGLRSR